MAKTVLRSAGISCAALLLLGARAAWAEEVSGVDRSAIFPKEEEEGEPTSLWAFWRDRIKLGYGFDETYNDNVLLEDNNRKNDLISTLESQIFFADSRGSLQYGLTQEVNAHRYHRANRNSIDWDGSAFCDFDPGGLYEFQLTYAMDATNALVRTADTTDLFRRSNDFQRQVKHEGKAKVLYSVNKIDKWVNVVSFSVLDDQVQQDASTDRKRLGLISTFDREFRPTWTLSAGYELEKLDVPGNKLKSSIAHFARFSLMHELTDDFELKGTFKYGKRNLHLGPSDSFATFEGDTKYPIPINPRLNITLGYTDTQTSSYAASATRLHSQQGTFGFEYELSPLLTFTGKAAYTKGQSSGSGSNATTSITRVFTTGLGLKWQVTTKGAFTLDHIFSRSKTRDTTNHRVIFGYEGEF